MHCNILGRQFNKMYKAIKLPNLISQKESRKIFLASFLGMLVVVLIPGFLNFFQYYFSVYLTLLIFLALIIWRVPEAGLHLSILATMIFERWFTLEPLVIGDSSFKLYPLDIVLIITAISVLLRLNPKKVLFSSQVVWPIVIFLGSVIFWCGLSYRWQGDPALIGSAMKNLVFYTLIFFIVVMLARKEEQWKRIMITILFGGLMIIGFIGYGLLSGQALWSEYTPLSTIGSRLLASTHAFFLILPIYLLLVFQASQKRFFGRIDTLIIFFWLIGLIVSLMRNLWLGWTAGIFLIFLLLEKKQSRKMILTLFKILFLALVSVMIMIWFSYLITADDSVIRPFILAIEQRFAALNFMSLTDESATFRLAAWNAAFKTFLNSPFLGLGFGQSLTFEFQDYENILDVRELHNTYAAMILQMGLLGSSFYFMLIFSVLLESFRALKTATLDKKPYVLALLGFLVMFLIVSFFGTYWETNFFMMFFWLAYGLVIAARNLDKPLEKAKI